MIPGELGIRLNSRIEASMRQDTYNPKAAVTCDGCLAASCCNCKAGCARATDRGVCVHILPMLLQLTSLLMNGLAQNILVELSHRWNEDLEEQIKESGREVDVRKSILALMIADSSRCIDDCNFAEVMSTAKCRDIKSILQKYSVGTEKAKVIHFQPREDELIPLRELKVISTKTTMKTILLERNKSKSNNTTTTSSSISSKNVLGKRKNKKQRLNLQEASVGISIDRQENASMICGTASEGKNDGGKDDDHDGEENVTLLKRIAGTGALAPIPCDFCNRNMTTNHVCRIAKPNGNRMIENENSQICGKATCIFCWEDVKLDASKHREICKCCATIPPQELDERSAVLPSSGGEEINEEIETSSTSAYDDHEQQYDDENREIPHHHVQEKFKPQY